MVDILTRADIKAQHNTVESVTIIFKGEGNTAWELVYRDNAWHSEGPIYPRMLRLMDVLTKFIKEGAVD